MKQLWLLVTDKGFKGHQKGVADGRVILSWLEGELCWNFLESQKGNPEKTPDSTAGSMIWAYYLSVLAWLWQLPAGKCLIPLGHPTKCAKSEILRQRLLCRDKDYWPPLCRTCVRTCLVLFSLLHVFVIGWWMFQTCTCIVRGVVFAYSQ